MLMVSVANVLLPSLTAWGRPVRRSRIQLQREVYIPRVVSLMISLEGNKDCVTCASVGPVCELEWVQGVWDDGVDVSPDQPFKTFLGYRYPG